MICAKSRLASAEWPQQKLVGNGSASAAGTGWRSKTALEPRNQGVGRKSNHCNTALANLTEHRKNIDTACEDTRLSAVEKIRRIKEEIDKAQICLPTMTAGLKVEN